MSTMLRWSPFDELDSLERQVRRAISGAGFGPTLLPAADIYETETEFVVELEVPGYEEKELAIEVFDHTVSVKGERTEAKEEEGKAFHLRERLAQEFERRFKLPSQADTEHVRAEFKQGVLELHTPKLDVPKPHRIEIAKP